MNSPELYVTKAPEPHTYLVHCPSLGIDRHMFTYRGTDYLSFAYDLVIRITTARLKLLQASAP